MLEKRLLVKYLSSVHQSTANDSAPLRGGGGGLHLNAIFPPLDMALMEISRHAFQAIQKPYHHILNLCCGVFCELLGDLWVYLGGVVFLEGLVKRN